MSSTKKKQPIDWSTLVLVILFILFVIGIIIFIVNKDEEKKRLRERLKMLTNRKRQIEILKSSLDMYFKYAYNTLKVICFSFVVAAIYLIYQSIPDKNIYEFASRLTAIVGTISLFIVIICVFIEENPINIFSMRHRIKILLKQAIYFPFKYQINQLPFLSSEIEEINDVLNN